MLCFDKPEELRLYGDFESLDSQFISIIVTRCQKNCKTEVEIDEFLDRYKYLGTSFIQKFYQPDVYDDGVISEKYVSKFHHFGPNSYLTIQKEILESEESFDGFGLNPRQETFFTVKSEVTNFEFDG